MPEAKSTSSDSLRARTVRGLTWTAIENGASHAVHLVVAVLLTRLLEPEEFGVVAMVTVFVAISQTLLDSGFSTALIQKKNLTYVEECSVFYFNIVVGILLALVLCLASPLIAAFYRQPDLKWLTCALSAVLVVRSLALVQRSLFAKRLDFKAQAQATVVASLASAVIGISLALAGFGAWALVGQQLTSASMQTALYWSISSWRPSALFSIHALRGLFGFGSRMMLSSLLDTGYRNIHTMVIGRVFSAADLGYYSRGHEFALAPGKIISSVLNRVAFPAMAEIQDDHERLVRAVRKALTTLAFFSLPALVGLALIAEPFVRVVLTDRWLPSVPILQLLCVTGAIYPLHVIHLSVLKAIGRSELFLRLEIIKKVLALSNIVIMIPFGLLAVVTGQALLSVVAYVLNSYFTATLLGYTYRQQFSDLSPIFAYCGVMASAVCLVRLTTDDSSAYLLMLQVLVGSIIYAAVSWARCSPPLQELLQILKVQRLSR